MSRLKIAIENEAVQTVERLYKDLERRIVASPPGICPVDLALNFLRLCHAQTCGKCVPCRIGLGQLAATTMDEMVEKFKANRGFVKACWCGDPECEGEVKYATGGAATRCLIEDEEMISDKCIWCGKPVEN